MISKKVFTVCIFLFCMGIFSNAAFSAGMYIHVPDMSKIKYQLTSDGHVYFRNLNEFNNQVTGCCYAFYLDTSTTFGKSAWSTILMKMASKKDLYMYVQKNDPPTSGDPVPINHIGNWQPLKPNIQIADLVFSEGDFSCLELQVLLSALNQTMSRGCSQSRANTD